MVKLNYVTPEQALTLVSFIKVNYDVKDWVMLNDFCRIYLYDDCELSRKEFNEVVSSLIGKDMKWSGHQLSISWKGGAK